MKGVFWWRLAVACVVYGALVAGQATADEAIAAGDKVIVVNRDAKFTLDGDAVCDAKLCNSFTVGFVEGDLLWIESKGAFLHQFDVVTKEEATDHFTRAIEDAPSPESYVTRGYFWLARDEFDRSIRDFSVATRLDPRSPLAYAYRSMAWHEKRCFDRAIADCNYAIRLDAEWAPPYVERGRALCRMDQLDKAIEDFNKAIRLDPESAYAFCARGEAYRKKGEFEWALGDFSRSIELEPADFSPRRGAARVYIAKGNYRLALAEYDQMVRVDRESGLNARAWLRATSPEPALRDGSAALLDASEACEMANWTDESCLETLSAALAELGMFDEAIKMLERSVKLAPDHSPKETAEMMVAFKAHKAYRYEPEF